MNMTPDRNDTPLEQADALNDLSRERTAHADALAVIRELDEHWPRRVLGGIAPLVTATCRYCDEHLPAHKTDCIARRILGIE